MQEEETNGEIEPRVPEVQETIGDVEVPEQEAPAEAMEMPTEAPRRLRRLLTWIVIVLLIFGLGVGASWALQIRPQAERIDALETDLESAESALEAAEAELAGLRPLKDENEALSEAIRRTEQHLDLLFVLVDVTSAQLAMAQEDTLAAKAALSGTDARLAGLEGALGANDAATVSGLRERLALVIEEVDTDEFASRRDLEILANNLLALERLLFGE